MHNSQQSNYESALDAIAIRQLTEPLPAPWQAVLQATPNSGLIRDNSFWRSVQEDENLFLISAVDRSKGLERLVGGMGCLGNVIYCAQAFRKTEGGYSIHNFGSSVMRHRDPRSYRPIVFNIPAESLSVGYVNYLQFGLLYSYMLNNSDILGSEEERQDFVQFAAQKQPAIESFANRVNEQYDANSPFQSVDAARDFINETAQLVDTFPSMAYWLFEAVSLSLMLLSRDEITRKLAAEGQWNHGSYIEFTHRLKDLHKDDQFGSYSFKPSFDEITTVLGSMQQDNLIDIDPSTFGIQTANNLILFMRNSLDAAEKIKGHLFFDYCFSGPNSPVLRPKFDTVLARLLNGYMTRRGFSVVINSAIEKGEIGIVVDNASAIKRIQTGEYDESWRFVSNLVTISPALKNIEEFH